MVSKIKSKDFFQEEYLKELTGKYIKHYTVSGNDGMNYSTFKRNESQIIKKISHDVLSNTYKFNTFKEKLIIKDRYSAPRCISIPTIRDRLTLKSLSILIEEYFKKIPSPKIPHDQIKRIGSIEREGKFDSYLKIDIKSFFASITHDKLLFMLKKQIRSKKIIDLITSAIKNPTGNEKNNCTGLPQGISISNYLAHIYLSEVDEKYINNDKLEFIRYVDDILIFCSFDELDNIYNQIEEDLNLLDLKINLAKKQNGNLKDLSREDPLNFLGYSFFYEKINNFIISINQNSVLAFEKKIVTIINKINGNPSTKQINRSLYELNRIITGSITREFDSGTLRTQRYGWLLFFSQMNDKYLLFRLDSLVNKKIQQLKRKNPNLSQLIKDNFEYKVKKLVTTYYEIKHNFEKTNYLFDPDAFSISDKRLFLEDVFGYTNVKLREMSEEDIEKMFYRNVYKRIYTDYKDILEVMSGY